METFVVIMNVNVTYVMLCDTNMLKYSHCRRKELIYISLCGVTGTLIVDVDLCNIS
jgi:hypothetical protein